MAAAYLPILILFAVGGIVGFVMVFGGWLLGPKNPTVYKEAPYECGVEPVGTARERFPIKFFLVAILFIIFDIESIFLYPWYTVFKSGSPEFQKFTLVEVGTFFLMLFVGYLYIVKRKAILFEDSTLVEPAPSTAEEEEVA
jgi:NADH-quinone oxidoreductase subunit A